MNGLPENRAAKRAAADRSGGDGEVTWDTEPRTDDRLARPDRIAVIGIGLLGGSFALAARQIWPAVKVVGVSRSLQTRNEAIGHGVATEVTEDLEQACEGCDWIVVATPVDAIAALVVRAAAASPATCRIIDVGSTKSRIVDAVGCVPAAAAKFVATHPIAGGEKSGPRHARSDLFRGRVTVLTPDRQTPRSLVADAAALWRRFGSRVVEMGPKEHDEALAAISHVPHLVASALALLPSSSQLELVGSGWLDTTRVASGSAELWTAICRENCEAIATELDRAAAGLSEMSAALRAGDFDRLTSLLIAAKAARDEVADRRPPHSSTCGKSSID